MIRVAFIIGDYPPDERRLREETAKSFSSAEVEIGIVSVADSAVVTAAEKTTARPVEPIGSEPCSAARLFTTFLRDGRATTIEGAILAQFAALAEEEKAKLVAFLRTL